MFKGVNKYINIMEPSIVDYYNSYPIGAKIIDQMNKELKEEQNKSEKLDSIINNYKNDIIFDVFFNHGIKIELQHKLKKEIYNDDDDIFLCKECNEYVYEPYGSAETLKYILYQDLNKKCSVCEFCFNNTEYEINIKELIPSIKEDYNYQFSKYLKFEVDMYICFFLMELKKKYKENKDTNIYSHFDTISKKKYVRLYKKDIDDYDLNNIDEYIINVIDKWF